MLDGTADEEKVRAAVMKSKLGIYAAYPKTTAQLKHRQYQVALAALDWLEKKYNLNKPPELMGSPPGDDPENPEDGNQPPPPQGREAAPPSARIDRSENKSLTKDEADDFAERKRKEILALLARRPTQDELVDSFDISLREGFLLGSGLDEIPEEEEEDIDKELALLFISIAAILAKAERGEDMESTATKMTSQVMRMYTIGLILYSIKAEELYTWELGATEDHCLDCAENASLGPMPGSFWKEKFEEGIFPQSGALECKGFHCDCSIRG